MSIPSPHFNQSQEKFPQSKFPSTFQGEFDQDQSRGKAKMEMRESLSLKAEKLGVRCKKTFEKGKYIKNQLQPYELKKGRNPKQKPSN